jgi:hypothetical protein
MDTRPDDGTLATGDSFTSQQMQQQGKHDMHAVIRETSYAPDRPLEDMPEFAQFQAAHAARAGYRGTIVTRIGDGRYVTLTLWASAADMDAARGARAGGAALAQPADDRADATLRHRRSGRRRSPALAVRLAARGEGGAER